MIRHGVYISDGKHILELCEMSEEMPLDYPIAYRTRYNDIDHLLKGDWGDESKLYWVAHVPNVIPYK